MEKLLVSAIISTYKRPIPVLKRAVKSVVNQSYDNIEIIVVNDYPEDSILSEEIAEMLSGFKDSRISYIIMPHNSGACAARNAGVNASYGEYVAFLDDDDEWCENKTELQLQGFTSDCIGLVYSPYYNITKDIPEQIIAWSSKNGNVSEEMLYRNIAGGCSMTMISRKALEICGAFDESLPSAQDYDLYLRISLKYEFKFVDAPLTYRYLLDESITKNPEKQRKGWELFISKHIDLYSQNKPAYSYRINRRVSTLLEEGNFSEALVYYKRGLKISILSKFNIIEPIKGMLKHYGYKNTKKFKVYR